MESVQGIFFWHRISFYIIEYEKDILTAKL